MIRLTNIPLGTQLTFGRFGKGFVLSVTAFPINLILAAETNSGDVRKGAESTSNLRFVDFPAGVGFPSVSVLVLRRALLAAHSEALRALPCCSATSIN